MESLYYELWNDNSEHNCKIKFDHTPMVHLAFILGKQQQAPLVWNLIRDNH